MQIETERVELATFGVTLKALMVDKRQMTMGVFRQLDRGDWLDHETGLERGILWGRVNYFWGDCKKDHLHIVWQQGDKILRDCLKDYADTQHLGQAVNNAVKLVAFILMDNEYPLIEKEGYNRKVTFKNGWWMRGFFESDLDKFWNEHAIREGHMKYRPATESEKLAWLRNSVKRERESCLKSVRDETGLEIATVDEALSAYKNISERLSLLKTNWASAYEKANSSEHLFIAV